MGVKYPNVKVKLIGKDGNAFAILAQVDKALKEAGVGKEIRNQFYKEATSGYYDKLLQVVCQWVKVS